MAARDQLGELAHDALAGVRLALLAVERQQVAAQEDLAVEVRLERAQHRVLAARQLGGDVVRELDLRPHPCSAARTSPDTRLPSARPSTAAIACFIAVPMSFADCAPLSRTACATIAAELLVGELRRQVAADQLALGLLAAGEILASRLAVGARPPPGGACARGAAPRARRREPSLAAFCSSESTRRSAPTLCLLAGAHRALQVGFDLLDDRHPQTRIRRSDDQRRAAALGRRTPITTCRAGDRQRIGCRA